MLFRSAILTFGGRSPTISGLANDTAQYVNGTWSPIATANAPSPRFLYGMAYDTLRNVTVLFGGRDNVGANNETWEFDGVNWAQVTTATAPAPREEFGMVFDRSLNRTVLFGGCDEANGLIFGDTWLYDGVSGTWVDATTAEAPTPRFRGSMVFDVARNRSIFFGGYDGAQLLSDTYEYAGSGWVLIPPSPNVPPNLTEAAHGYNEVSREFVLFGGFGGSFTSETWEYTGANTGLFGLTGDGCPTAVGVPGLTATTPRIGTTMTLTIDNLGAAPGALVVLGLSNQDYLGNPIPFDLGLIGLPGCNLYQSADSINLTIATAGEATFDLLIPVQPALLNNSVYCQGVAIDVVPFLQFLGTTRGGRALIGN